MSVHSLWERIRGHDETIGRLRGVIDRSRPAHAYLFFGPRGVGKAKTALAFAAALNCTQGVVACGVCESCRAIQNHTHPDVHFIEPDGAHEILIAQVRELIHAVNMKKSPGNYKVAIIDDAHLLRQEAANALLKTLEEPHEGIIFVLVATSVARMLATIASRCQRVVFGALAPATVRAILVDDHGIDPATAGLAARLAHGMVGEAIELASSELLSRRGDILRDLLIEPDVNRLVELVSGLIASVKAGSVSVKQANDAKLDELKGFLGDSSKGLIRQVEARQKRELGRLEQRGYRQILLVLASLYRDVLIVSEDVDDRFVANSDLIAEVRRARATTAQVRSAVAGIEEAGRRLQQNVSPLLTFENLFLTLEAVA